MDEPLRRGLTFGVPACITSCLAAVAVGLVVTATLGTGPFSTSSSRDAIRSLRVPDAKQSPRDGFASLAPFATRGIAPDGAGTVTLSSGATPLEAGLSGSSAGGTIADGSAGNRDGRSVGAFDGNDLPSIGRRGRDTTPTTGETAPATPLPNLAASADVAATADPTSAPVTPAAAGRRRTVLKVLSVADVPTPGSPVARTKVAMAVTYADTGELRRYLNFTLASNPKKLTTPGQAMRARVDLVDKPQADGTLARSVRVRMDVVGSTAASQQVDDLGSGDGNSNVIQVTTPLTAPSATAPTASAFAADATAAATRTVTDEPTSDDSKIVLDEAQPEAEVAAATDDADAPAPDAAVDADAPAQDERVDAGAPAQEKRVATAAEPETDTPETEPAAASTQPEASQAADDAPTTDDPSTTDDASTTDNRPTKDGSSTTDGSSTADDAPTLAPTADGAADAKPQSDTASDPTGSDAPTTPASTESTVTEILLPLDDSTDDQAPPTAAASNLVSSTVAAPATPTTPTDPTTPTAIAVPVNVKLITQPPKPGDTAAAAAAAPIPDE